MAMKGEKPNAARAGWKLRDSKTLWENELFRLREDEVELPGGNQQKYAYFERDEAVVIVPVTRDGQLVMLEQYRYPVDEWCLEIPAGGSHDSKELSLDEVARKELREEIGATAGKLTHIDFFYSANSLTDEKCHIFLAEEVELTKEQNTESSEEIRIKLVPVDKAVELARTGAVKTGPCALAILLCEERLRQLGQHRERPAHMLET